MNKEKFQSALKFIAGIIGFGLIIALIVSAIIRKSSS
jgi:hypothetical protein